MAASACCPRCGTTLTQSTNDVTLCLACSAAPSTPWWVEAAQPVPPPPNVPPPARSTRLRKWRIAAATALVLITGLLFSLWPRGNSAEPTTPQVSSTEHEMPTEAVAESTAPAENARAAATLDPLPSLLDRPSPDAKRPPGGSDALASSTPPPLPSPPSEVKQDAPAKPAVPHGLHRLDLATEEELRRQAATAPEVGLGSTGPAIVDSYLAKVPANEVALGTPALTDAAPLLDVRPDLRILPIRFGDTCKLNGKLTVSLDVLSRKLRSYLDRFTPKTPTGRGGSSEKLRQTLLTEMRGKKPEWLRPEAVPALLQILMGEETPFRKILVELLTKIEGPAATTALAQRAVFDLSPEVGEMAVTALKDRPAAVYRPVLLKTMRYPWAVPVQHAAEALVALHDTGSVPVLVSLLKLPDPAGPLTLHKNRQILQDVVRLNHLNNCLMCHPPAATDKEPVLGVDPVVPLPVRLQTPGMMSASQRVAGGHGHGSSSVRISVPTTTTSTLQLPLLIRGDITFLRQDFTVRVPVGTVRPRQGTNIVRRQRFDFVLRTRILPRKVYEKLEEVIADRPSYPQRDAILFALRELTGKDAGPTTEAWVQMFPDAETTVEAARLGRQIVKADGVEREVMLAKFRDSKGIVYTQALADAIPHLQGVAREHVRGMLAERLTRMSVKTLGDYLQDEDPEIRRAAVVACGRKDKKQVVPELTALLDTSEPVTARLAEEGLASLTGERLKHPDAWKEWWKKHSEQAAPE
jgi:hypothetical protein